MKLPFKQGKEVVFENVEPPQKFTLENQDGELTDVMDIDVEDYLEDMFDSPDQFVILTAPKPQYKVRYIQARTHGECTNEENIEVEIGVEEEGTRLYYKMCSREECCRIFLDFYDGMFVPEMKEYKPVEF